MVFPSRILPYFALLIAACLGDVTHPLSRRVEVRNESNEKLAIEWVHPLTGEVVSFGETKRGESIAFDSFVNHTFRFRSLLDNQTDVSIVTVSPDEKDQVILIKEKLQVELLHKTPRTEQFSSMSEQCRPMYKYSLAMGHSHEVAANSLAECVLQETAKMIQTKNEELAFEKEVRRSIANIAENYTCADPRLQTTTPKANSTWFYEGQERTVGILHSRRDSQIHIIHDFISAQECLAIQKAAEPLLHRGTVADVSLLQRASLT
jgi:hypothetical protein